MEEQENAPGFAARFGIRMQATRSRPPKRRWSREWLAYMESLHMGARIGRGRQYATGGNVRDIAVSPGSAVATVKGGAPQPYRCEISCETVPGDVRASLISYLRSRPMLLAGLLSGDLPEAAETRFRAEGCPLAPSVFSPLAAHCSCPDGAPFCKHAAAVLFRLGERFDADPLLLLEFRGIPRAALFGPPSPEQPGAAALQAADPGATLPDTANPDTGATAPADAPLASGDLLEFPGPFPFWRGESRFEDSIRECIDRAASAAAKAF